MSTLNQKTQEEDKDNSILSLHEEGKIVPF